MRLRMLRLKILGSLSSVLIVGAVISIIAVLFLFIWYSRDLPSPDQARRKEGFSTVILDRNNKPIYDIFVDKNRIPVVLNDIPDSLKKATIAIEDQDFYKHQGFDPKGIFRAIFRIITFQGIQGGSTLTQQLVKNVLLSSERSLPRKIKEFILAVQIERKYSKDEILQMYLNEAPYGGTYWGIESASQGYFGKHTKDLTLLESVVLAGLPQRPSVYSPISGKPNAFISRSEEVLRRMREDEYITQAEELELKRQLPQLKIASTSSVARAYHFVEYVKKQLIERFGESAVEKGGFRVRTTLDAALQAQVETIVKEEIDKLQGLKVSNGAAIVISPQTGEILSYVGSREYESEDENFQGKFDVVSMGLRQPGSALKPITYAAAFTKGYTPSTLIMDVETHFPGGVGSSDYIPKNYDNKFRGPVQVRYALSNSINVPAVKMTALVGVKDILELSYAMGLSTLSPSDDNVKRFGLSLTLGGGEVKLIDLASAYGVFATGGIRNDLYSILSVTDGSGKTLYEHKSVSGKRVIPSDVSFLISDILSDNEARKDVFGTRSYLYIPGRTVAVKTGTTDDKKDNWTVGFTPAIVAAVWVGNNDNTPMDSKLASGVTGASPIWNRIMKEALRKVDDEPFEKPGNVENVTIDAFGGGLPHEGKSTRSEYFIKGTEPTSISSVYKKIKLSKSDNNKLANAVEIATGSFDEKEFIVFAESDPTSGTDGKNRWQEGIDAWVEKQGDSLYHPPKDTASTDENNVVVKIKSPANQTQVDTNDFEIIAEAKALRDIKKIELYDNGNLKKSWNNNSIVESFHFDTGVHTIKVKAYDEKGNTGETEITIGVKTSPVVATSTPVPPSPSATP